ncbi:gustatory receptor for sugar taste 64f-like [Aphidius gifuensis]|uniref:gustatory receptor for sugar taste 64f-like n=1 Tax=Aphidius gifuensis TaxID=684658 RepID=UPI001CDD1840|nr:gustatory receptor for sugar taste 64f-like [Aphidius gifuensis]
MSIEPCEIVIDEASQTDNEDNTDSFHFPPRSRRVIDNASSAIQQSPVFINQTTTRKKSHKNYLNNVHDFHSAMGPIITIGQYFGVFAIDGIKNPTPETMTFKIKSFRTIYSCGVSLNILILLYCIVFHIIRESINKNKEVSSSLIPFGIFIGLSFLINVICICRSQMWIDLQMKWKKVEETLDMFYLHTPQLRIKFQIFFSLAEIFKLGAHVMAVVFSAKNANGVIEQIQLRGKFLVDAFYGSNDISFDSWLGILGIYFLIILVFASFIRMFTDLFIIFLAIGLTERYKAMNEHVSDLIKSNCQPINWSRLKIHYEMLSDLVRETDRVISPLIFLSIGSNIYFICIYLLDGLIPQHDGILNAIYFFGGFVLLVIKTIAVILFAARINDESKKPILFLSKCPVQGPSFEPQWLQLQLSIDEVALTAMNCFSITRKFLITVTTTVISYEIVLLQFQKSMN